MTDILLIRHGENEYTRKGKLAGWMPGVHLNETGQAQAQALAERLMKAPLKAIYSSPLERALETARPLAQARNLPIQKCEGIGEVRYGEWTGRSLKVLARTKLWKVVQRQPSAMEFPGGETIRAVQARAVEAVEGIVKRHPKALVALFSHGDVIKLIAAYYLGMPLDTFQRVAISTGSITVIRVSPGMPMVMRMNEQAVVAGKK
jgi:probable phosphoglycerate mutase